MEQYGIPAWVSISCKDGTFTNHGEMFAAECVPLLAACTGVAAIGINCTAPKYLRQLLGEARDALAAVAAAADEALSSGHTPVLLCYPNSGEEWDSEARSWKPGGEGARPTGFACAAREWVAAGSRMVGGCCKTTPEHISELRKALL